MSDSSSLWSMLVLLGILSNISDLYLLVLEVGRGRELPGELLDWLVLATAGVAGLVWSASDSSEEK